jgi:hypothetical protein
VIHRGARLTDAEAERLVAGLRVLDDGGNGGQDDDGGAGGGRGSDDENGDD